MKVRIRGHQESVSSPSPEDLPQAMRPARVSDPAWRSDGGHPRKRSGRRAELAPKCLPAPTGCPMLSWHLCVLSRSATMVLQRPREAKPGSPLVCMWWAAGKPAQKQTSSFFTPIGILVRHWHRRGSSCSTAIHLGAELGISGPDLVLFPQCLVLPLLVSR